MVTLNFLFWMLVVLFGVIGAMRGWAKELLVTFSAILALALITLLKTYIPFVNTLPKDSSTLFWIQTIILCTLVFFGYQTVYIPRLAPKAHRERLSDSLLGFFLGVLNAWFIFGSLWFFMAQAGYPFPNLVSQPVPGTPQGDAAISMLAYLPPVLFQAPLVYFAVILSFIFVLVVFI
jgi:uncharacterized membrane protein required for colicin V production